MVYTTNPVSSFGTPAPDAARMHDYWPGVKDDLPADRSPRRVADTRFA